MRSILGPGFGTDIPTVTYVDDGFGYLRSVFAQIDFEGTDTLTVEDFRAIEAALLDDEIDLSTQVRAALNAIGFFDAPARRTPRTRTPDRFFSVCAFSGRIR